MSKKAFYTALALISLIGTLTIGMVSAVETSVIPGEQDIFYTLNGNQPFTAKILTITDCDVENPAEGCAIITILDRNLGATAAGTGCEDLEGRGVCMNGTEDATYGYHFQWGNNYGFKPNFNSDDTFPGGEEVQEFNIANVDASNYGPENYYSGNIFITDSDPRELNNGDWSIVKNDGLRGGTLISSTDGYDENKVNIDIWNEEYLSGDGWKVTNPVDRQGPCPKGFHVPSAGELSKLASMFDNNPIDMHNHLQIPFADRRIGRIDRISMMGKSSYLWSSSPYSAHSRAIYFVVTGGLRMDGYGRSNALSIRCFYNYYSPYQFSFSLMSGDVLLTGGRILPGEKLSETVDFDNIDVMKDGFKFDGWFLSGVDSSFDLETPITGDIVLYAQRSENKPSDGGNTVGGSSSGGGSRGGNNKNTEDRDFNNQNDDTSTGIDENKNNSTQGNENNSNVTEGQKYSEEFQQAYEFAYKNGITTMDSIDKADMEGTLTRIAMAKMLSQYAINVLGKKPENITVPKFDDITKELNNDYGGAVTQSYQLGIMGINMPNNRFRPYDLVPRSEFVTALSRLLYKIEDGKPYYKPHLDKLMKEGIITNDDYNMEELRGYVMIMLNRSTK